MRFILLCCSLVLSTFLAKAQGLRLPFDLRQHNLTQFNSNLMNATYMSDWNRPHSFSVWTRWQWQTVDGDPTTIFASYSHKLSTASSFGIGFLQHNTGTFLDVGANLNYTHTFSLGTDTKILVGSNIFGFQRKLADDRFIVETDTAMTQLENDGEFIVVVSPAVRLQINTFNLGIALENVLDFNLSETGEEMDLGIVTGTLSNDFPVSIFSKDGGSFVRPMVYIKAIPDEDTQFGINGLFSTSRFWVQGGYNSFYGASGGLGVTFAKQFSIGGLLEFGTDTSLAEEDPTFELVASYHFGLPRDPNKVVDSKEEQEDVRALEPVEEQEGLERQKQLEAEQEEQRKRDKEQRLKESERLAMQLEKQRMDSIAAAQLKERKLLEEQHRRDSIAMAQLKEKTLLEEQQRKDSIAQLLNGEVEVKKNEVYREVSSDEGMEPGFYLIANVFGTQKYFESFMLTLKQKGLEPKSFYRSKDKYNYVYLGRYNSMSEAREARDSKFFGKYADKTWIFRVRGN